MKTHYFIIFLFFIFCQGCKKDLPSTTTIVQGNLVDENNNPVEGVKFGIGGFYYKGISPVPTFDEIVYTDKQGNFTFGKLVSSPTKYVDIYKLDSYSDKIFQFEDTNGIFQKWSGTLFIGIGQENTFNFKLIKR